jgi:hypothetical protein
MLEFTKRGLIMLILVSTILQLHSALGQDKTFAQTGKLNLDKQGATRQLEPETAVTKQEQQTRLAFKALNARIDALEAKKLQRIRSLVELKSLQLTKINARLAKLESANTEQTAAKFGQALGKLTKVAQQFDSAPAVLTDQTSLTTALTNAAATGSGTHAVVDVPADMPWAEIGKGVDKFIAVRFDWCIVSEPFDWQKPLIAVSTKRIHLSSDCPHLRGFDKWLGWWNKRQNIRETECAKKRCVHSSAS